MKVFIIDDSSSDQRIDRYLEKLYVSTSKNTIQKWIRKKKIKVNSSKVEPKYRLQCGDEVTIFLPDVLLEESRKKKREKLLQDVDLDIFYEDDEILIINKPSGLLVHPANKEYKKALSTMVESYLYDSITPTFSPASIQRLDYNTSGLILFCKTYSALKKYNELMRTRAINKYYLALVEGEIDREIVVNAYLLKDEKKNTVKLYNYKKEGCKEVKSVVRPIETNGRYSKVEVEIMTGRTHQIRASLSHIGHPIVGDVKYGGKVVSGQKYQNLVSYKLVVEDRVYELCYHNKIWNKLLKK